MKEVFITLTSIILAVTLFSFNNALPPRIYPEIDAWFKKAEGKSPSNVSMATLENLRKNFAVSQLDEVDWNYIFYCSDNSTTSQAAQVFLQTLSYSRRLKNIRVYSAGNQAGTIDKSLIAELSRIGYKIKEVTKDGKPAYEVTFGEKAPVIVLYAKPTAEKSLPVSNTISIILCDTASQQCSQIKTASTPYHVPVEQSKVSTSEMLANITRTVVYIAKK